MLQSLATKLEKYQDSEDDFIEKYSGIWTTGSFIEGLDTLLFSVWKTSSILISFSNYMKIKYTKDLSIV